MAASALDMALDDVIKTKGNKRGRGEKKAGAGVNTKQPTAAVKAQEPKVAPGDKTGPARTSVRGRLGLAKGAAAALAPAAKAAAAAAKATASTVTGGAATTPAAKAAAARRAAAPAASAAVAKGSIKGTEAKLGMTLEDMIKTELKSKSDPKKEKADPKAKAKAKAKADGGAGGRRGSRAARGGGASKWVSGMKRRMAMASEAAWASAGSAPKRMRSMADAPVPRWAQKGAGKGGDRDSWGRGAMRSDRGADRWSAGGRGSGAMRSERWSAGGAPSHWGGGSSASNWGDRSWLGGGGGGGGGYDRSGYDRERFGGSRFGSDRGIGYDGGRRGGMHTQELESWANSRSGAANGSARATASRGATRDSQGCKIKVSNVPRNLDQRDIQEAFEDNGRVVRCEVERGVAWVTFERAIDAKKAMQTFDRGELNGQTIYVSAA